MTRTVSVSSAWSEQLGQWGSDRVERRLMLFPDFAATAPWFPVPTHSGAYEWCGRATQESRL
jgi:hypothetical protein